ncbi:hypothetical protein MVEG_11387 [Podila verticillata NRRL 6337]|uniref:ATP-dependent DNA helicase n=1 Tax=Podila verticillata NRRL 6337 TaxID=1069443 RepID=A0A086TLN5_9FUNG|nr:hypothetical protein MVEG_11387 [Podila verticillata NRRL 6337]
MHSLMLHHPWTKDFDTWIGPGTKHETYQSLALEHLRRDEIGRLADGLLDVLDHPNAYDNPVNQDSSDQLEDFEWTVDQKNVLDTVKDSFPDLEGCRILVTGAAGTGKSAVLKEICKITKDNRFQLIRLAPSGVAAMNIKSQTIAPDAAHVDCGTAFGGFPVKLFGDSGQPGSINKALYTTDWLGKSDHYRSFQRTDLLQAC